MDDLMIDVMKAIDHQKFTVMSNLDYIVICKF